MKTLLSLFFCSLSLLSICNDTIAERVDYLSSLMESYPDSATALSYELLEHSINEEDDYGMVQANFLLAYIYDRIKVNHSKAIIYYLEAIRYAEKGNYKRRQANLISLNKNCGILFGRFKAYELSLKYYENALLLAQEINSLRQIINISYNMSFTYSEMGNQDAAIKILESISPQLSPGDSKYFDLNNRLSLIYLQISEISKADSLTRKLLKNGTPDKLEFIDVNQILGTIARMQGEFEIAQHHYGLARDTAHIVDEGYDKNRSLIECYNYLGISYFEGGSFELALENFKKAEEVIPNVPQKPNFISIYKKIANCHFELGQFIEAKIYEDRYFKNLNAYIEQQEALQQTDKRYNMDLITKRYFDEVAKQEQIASILFYSKLISGILMALLLLNIGYTRYQKVKLRKALTQELSDLKIID